MTSIDKNIITQYINSKDNENKIDPNLKNKLAEALSNDGVIDEKEEASLLNAVQQENASKGGNGDLAAKEFNTFMKKVANVTSSANFDPKGFEFSVDNGNVFINPKKNTPPVENKTSNDSTTEPEKYNYKTDEAKELGKVIKTLNKNNDIQVRVSAKTGVPYFLSKGKDAEVKELQEKLGVKVDGRIGPQTLQKLKDEVEKLTKLQNISPALKKKLEDLLALSEKLGLKDTLKDKKILGVEAKTLLDPSVAIKEKQAIPVSTEDAKVDTNIQTRKLVEVPKKDENTEQKVTKEETPVQTNQPTENKEEKITKAKTSFKSDVFNSLFGNIPEIKNEKAEKSFNDNPIKFIATISAMGLPKNEELDINYSNLMEELDKPENQNANKYFQLINDDRYKIFFSAIPSKDIEPLIASTF